MGHLVVPLSSVFLPRTVGLTDGGTGREPSCLHGKSIERRKEKQCSMP